jgi:uncharacterized protein (TIGR03435 family)
MRAIPVLGPVIISIVAILGRAQDNPRFDVTSVKVNKLEPRQREYKFGCANGDFVSRGLNLRPTLVWAFDLKAYQFAGLPPWVDSADAIFDIEGKAGTSLTENQCKLMVQALLADRFKLVTHREPKEISIYALVIAKGGPKFKPASGDQQTKVTVNGTPARIAAQPGATKAPGGWSMEQLINILSAPAFTGGRPIFDRTGLEGLYQFSLDFSQTGQGGQPLTDAPDLFTALEQQMGLRLEERKEPVQMLVFDHLESPDAN